MPATRPRSFRLAEHELERVERVGEHLHISQGRAVALAVMLLEEKLGLRRQDAVALSEDLARRYGDEALITAILRHDEQNGYYAELKVADWPADEFGLEPWLTMAIGETGPGTGRLDAVTFHVRDSQHVDYLLGTVTAPSEGDELSVRVIDLPDLVVARDERDPMWRENLKMDLKLRALLHGADEDEED